MSAERTIILSGKFEHLEFDAAAILSPGNILVVNSAGKAAKNTTEGADGELLVARENYINGKTIDDAYAVDDTVIAGVLQRGAQAQVILKAGENVAVGEYLIFDDAGRVIAESSAGSGVTAKRKFVATEALDLSDSGDVDTLISARAI